jgi:hypothetical protein
MCLSNVSTSHCCSFAGKQVAVHEAMDNEIVGKARPA